MKSPKNEVNNGLDDFIDPVSQAFRNVRDSVTDGISDAVADHYEKGGKYSAPRKKGCLGTVLKWSILLILIGGMLSECGFKEESSTQNTVSTTTQPSMVEQVGKEQAPTDTQMMESIAPAEYTGYSQLGLIEKQIAYAAECDIDLHRFPKQEGALFRWLSSYSGNAVYLDTDNAFGADRYKRTEGRNGYLYYGELKDNRPDGYGILLKESELFTQFLVFEDRCYDLLYIGQFAAGKYDSFGLKFTTTSGGYDIFSKLCPYEEGTDAYITGYLNWVNYVSYFGEFSKGMESGKGNKFGLTDGYIGLWENVKDSFNFDTPRYYSIDVGEYQSGKLNGDAKQYVRGWLWYDGEMKDDCFNGYGKRYYPQSSQVVYEGYFKDNQRHGTGTSYSESGEIVYQGEWRYDEYK